MPIRKEAKTNLNLNTEISKQKVVISLFIIITAGFILRISYHHRVFSQGQVFLHEVDAYYHLRQAIYTAKNYPQLLQKDFFTGFPYGMEAHFGPFMAFFTASLAKLFSFNRPPSDIVPTIAVFIPPIIGSLTILIVYLLFRIFISSYNALLASAFFTFLPGSFLNSHIGYYDTDVWELFIFALLSWLFFSLLKYIEENKPVKKIYKYAFTWGLTTGWAFYIWPGTTTFAIFFILILCCLFLLQDFKKDNINKWLKVSIISYTIAGLISFPLYKFSSLGKAGFIVFDRLSWFQPILLFSISLSFALVYKIISYIDIKRKFSFIAYLLLSFLFTGILLLSLSPSIRQALTNGLYYFIHPDPWFAQVQEAKPFFAVYSLPYSVKLFSLAFIFIPLFIVGGIYIYSFRPKVNLLNAITKNNHLLLAEIVWLTLVLALSLLKIRTCYLLLPALPLMGLQLANFFAREKKVVITLITLAFYSVCFFWWFNDYSRAFHKVNLAERKTYEWIKNNTPSAGNIWQPSQKPDYAIMNFWNSGHKLLYLAQRPVVGNNFHINRRGNFISTAFFLAKSENIMSRFMNISHSKYFLANIEELFLLDNMAASLGLKKESEFIRYIGGKNEQEFMQLTTKAWQLPVVRLILADGSAIKEKYTALEHFRLIYESPVYRNFGNLKVANYKFFEYVPGARIIGLAEPNQTVKLRLYLQTEDGRPFIYYNFTKTDEKGAFVFIVPYTTEVAQGIVKAKEPAQIIYQERIKKITISQKAVEKGKILDIIVF